MHAIRVDRLTKRYGSTVALDGVSFEAKPGRITGFLGRNGAGKTTTLRILVGLAAPTSGMATIGGLPYQRIADPARHVGALLDGAGFHPGLSARSQLRALARAIGLPDGRADEVLALADLADAGDRKTGRLSLGMRQRLALAAVLLADPSVLILDEPANGLDPQGLRWLRDLLRRLAGEGRTILVSSHQLHEVALVADDVVVLHGGRVVATGAVTDLSRSRVVASTPEADVLAAVLAEVGVRAVRNGDTVEIDDEDFTAADIGNVAAAIGVRLHGLWEETASMEEMFFSSIGSGWAA